MTGVIVAATRQESGEDYVGTSDENGRFRVEVPAGTYRGTVYFYDTTLALREVRVEVHEVTRWDVEIDHALVMSDGDQDHTPRCPDIVGEAEVSPVEIDKVLASALDHFVADDSTLADSRSKVFVEKEIGVRCTTDLHCSLDAHVNSGAMPRSGLRSYAVKSREDLQALADRTRKDVEHVRFSQVDIVGDCAIVEVGLSAMTPTGTWDHVRRCRHTDLYEKRDGKWRFKLTAKQTCE